MKPLCASTFGSIDDCRETPAFRVIETRHPGGCRLPRHAHARSGITLVIDGDYREQTDRQEFMCGPGSVIFKPAGAAHRNDYSPSGAKSLHLEVNEQTLAEDSLQLPDSPTVLTGARVGYTACQLAAEFHLADSSSRLAMDALGMELLCLLARSRSSGASMTAPQWIQRTVALIHASPCEALSLRDVSLAVDVPPRQVARGFRRWMHCSVGEYARRVRIDQAAERLRRTDQPIALIALETGFCDQSHFTRVFGRIVGTPPAEYRRMCRGKHTRV